MKTEDIGLWEIEKSPTRRTGCKIYKEIIPSSLGTINEAVPPFTEIKGNESQCLDCCTYTKITKGLENKYKDRKKLDSYNLEGKSIEHGQKK